MANESNDSVDFIKIRLQDFKDGLILISEHGETKEERDKAKIQANAVGMAIDCFLVAELDFLDARIKELDFQLNLEEGI